MNNLPLEEDTMSNLPFIGGQFTDRQVRYRRSKEDPAKLVPCIEVCWPGQDRNELAVVKENGAIVLERDLQYDAAYHDPA